MENSPPVIQTMPRGVLPGTGAAFGTVGRKLAPLDGGSGAGVAAGCLATGALDAAMWSPECGDIAADAGDLVYRAAPTMTANKIAATRNVKTPLLVREVGLVSVTFCECLLATIDVLFSVNSLEIYRDAK